MTDYHYHLPWCVASLSLLWCLQQEKPWCCFSPSLQHHALCLTALSLSYHSNNLNTYVKCQLPVTAASERIWLWANKGKIYLQTWDNKDKLMSKKEPNEVQANNICIFALFSLCCQSRIRTATKRSSLLIIGQAQVWFDLTQFTPNQPFYFLFSVPTICTLWRFVYWSGYGAVI